VDDVTVPESLRSLRVALVHDYLNQPGGAERVVEVFTRMFPDAPLYTSTYDAGSMPDYWRSVDVRTSYLQRLSPSVRLVKAFTPLYPAAFESFDLTGYDLVLSSSTTFAKGVITRPETCHVCYLNNTTRFLWMYHDYIRHERLPPGARAVLPWLSTPIRVWDYAAAQRVDAFVAGSYNAARRIWKYYRRESEVLQPPIDAAAFSPQPDHGDYFLVLARLQPYKRLDLAVEACTRLGLPLHVVGDGPDRSRLQRLAGPTVRFLGRVPDQEVANQLAGCRALIWPGEEDFGLAPLEAQASGRPVIALEAGGALETVKGDETGMFFSTPTVESLVHALESFTDHYDPAALRRHALRFDQAAFTERLYGLLSRQYDEHQEKLRQISGGGCNR
jgi:glycosyltransferase involved in cell wall biosynthesis